ncbi:hypothetical protein BpHYR1_023061 [Brachionus plicatilis]|uniref:Uncharacterized protein n=1 Tax=Brachionus plicatilis TaxID=10195 RepID=A0A3M7QBB1_BRAPC|nr:hypothetical protein BpHYR1_023061 [Brachionus plicatilis]
MFDYFGLGRGKCDVSDRSNKDQCHNVSFVVSRAQAKERLLKYDSINKKKEFGPELDFRINIIKLIIINNINSYDFVLIQASSLVSVVNYSDTESECTHYTKDKVIHELDIEDLATDFAKNLTKFESESDNEDSEKENFILSKKIK